MNAVPKPSVALRRLGRASRSNVANASSKSFDCDPCASGTVAPAASSRLEVPGVTSMYFTPRAERGRTRSRVSLLSGSTLLSSCISTTAIPRRRPPWVLTAPSMRDTAPTRKPPMRTSLPLTSLAPVGSSALSVYVGTNGRPELAL